MSLTALIILLDSVALAAGQPRPVPETSLIPARPEELVFDKFEFDVPNGEVVVSKNTNELKIPRTGPFLGCSNRSDTCHRRSTRHATMSRPRWPDSRNAVSEKLGTVQTNCCA